MEIAILIGIVLNLLQEKVNAKKLAEKFEISTRTVYRYVDILCQSGVPIASKLGKNGGFFVEQNFEINNMFFTLKELDELLGCSLTPSLKQKIKFLKSKIQKNPEFS